MTDHDRNVEKVALAMAEAADGMRNEYRDVARVILANPKAVRDALVKTTRPS